ncbi:MAG: tetratricopeptide repeat protein [Deltaproteobacteria bacterium]
MSGYQPGKTRINPYSVACAFIPVVLAFLVYYGSLANGFVYDDNEQVLRNPWITSIGYLDDIFLSDSFGFFKETFQKVSYRPIMFVVYMAEYAMFGISPWGWHLTNVLLHGINGMMVFLVISRLLAMREDGAGLSSPAVYLAPLVGAAVFVTLPVNAEVVSWVGCVPELSYTLFLLVAFYLYTLAWQGQRSTLPHVLSAVFFFLALLSKETAIIFPVMVFLYDLARDRYEGLFASTRIVRYLPMAAAVAVYLIVRSYIIGGVARSGGIDTGVSDYLYFINAFPLFINYLTALVLPVNDYPLQVFEPFLSASEPMVIISVVLVLAFAVFALIFRRRFSALHLFAVVCIILPLLPALYVPTFSRTPFADRYLYFSTFGFSLLVAMGARSAMMHRGRLYAAVLVFLLIVLTVVNSVWAAGRSRIWKDDATLWTFAAKGSEKNHVAIHSLGYLAMKAGRVDEAISFLERSKRLNNESSFPDRTLLIMTQSILGAGYQKKGLLDKAVSEYNDVLRFAPEDSFVNYNLGTIYQQQGFLADAVDLYMTALLLTDDPVHRKEIYANLGGAYADLGKRAEALDAYSEALRLAPDDPVLRQAAEGMQGLR